MKAARKIGNNVTEIGKAGTYTQGLLSLIRSMAVIGDQNTLALAIESAKRGERSVVEQIQPGPSTGNLTNNTGIENRIFKEMKKEKTENDMDDLTKQMERLITLVERQNGNRYRNYERNNGNGNYDRRNNYQNNGNRTTREVECWTCHKTGHYSTECPNRRQDNYRDDRRRNENRNNGNNGNNRNNERSLNYLSVTREEREAHEYDNSSTEDEEEERQIFVNTRDRKSVV